MSHAVTVCLSVLCSNPPSRRAPTVNHYLLLPTERKMRLQRCYLDRLSGAQYCTSWPANRCSSYTHISYHNKNLKQLRICFTNRSIYFHSDLIIFTSNFFWPFLFFPTAIFSSTMWCGTTSFPRSSFVRRSIHRTSRYPDHSIDIQVPRP